MNYQHYKIEDFLADEDFKQWVLASDKRRNQFWQSWIQSHPEKETLVRTAREIILAVKFKNAELSNERQEETLTAILKADKQNDTQQTRSGKFLTLKVAASILILLSLSIAIYFIAEQEKSLMQVATIEKITKSNPAGLKTTILLPDSTKVYLNSETSITFPKQFSDSVREVTLIGEAFFDVKENAHWPFVVRTDNINTTVLGTSFNIKTFPDDSHIQISLISGKIKISKENSNNDLYLEPGYQAFYHKEKDRLHNRKFNIEKVLSWKNGVLYFNKENLKRVVEKLERWYGVDITIAGTPPADFVVSGQFHNESLDNVLETMQYGRYFEYIIQNKTVKLIF
jgi:transmembrane sensor